MRTFQDRPGVFKLCLKVPPSNPLEETTADASDDPGHEQAGQLGSGQSGQLGVSGSGHGVGAQDFAGATLFTGCGAPPPVNELPMRAPIKPPTAATMSVDRFAFTILLQQWKLANAYT